MYSLTSEKFKYNLIKYDTNLLAIPLLKLRTLLRHTTNHVPKEKSSRINRNPVTKEVNENKKKGYKIKDFISMTLNTFKTRLKEHVSDININGAKTTLIIKRGIRLNAIWSR